MNRYGAAPQASRLFGRACAVLAIMMTVLCFNTSAYAACTNPAGQEGETVYNKAYSVLQYCDNTNWIAMMGGDLYYSLSTVSTANLASYWKMDETSGTTAVDSSGNGNDATMGNTMNGTDDTVTGVVNRGLNFINADNHYMDAGNDATVTNIFTGGGTIAAWVKPTADAEATIILKTTNVTTLPDGFDFTIKSNQRPGFRHSFTGGRYEWNTYAGETVPLNQWSHVAVVYNKDSSANDPIFYINGVAMTTYRNIIGSPTDPAQSDASQNVIIGSSWTDAQLDDVRMYSRALSASEIAALADVPSPSGGGASVSTSSMMGYWKMNDASGATVIDSSGNGNNGTWTDATDNTITVEAVAGQKEGALDFEETDSGEINISPDATINNMSQISVCAWIKPESAGDGGAYPMIMSKADNADNGWNFYYTASSMALGFYTNEYAYVEKNTPSVSIGTWQHVCGTWDGTDGTSGISVYINGSELTSVSTSGD